MTSTSSSTQQNLRLPTGLSQLPSITAIIRERAVVQFDENPCASPGKEGDDDDDYTLSAYGDISLSNDSFLPGMLGELTPIRKKTKTKKVVDGSPLKVVNGSPKRRGSVSSPLKLGQKGRKSPPPAFSNGLFDEYALPPLLRKILPASPTKVKQNNKATFEDMMEKRTMAVIHAPRALRAVKMNVSSV